MARLTRPWWQSGCYWGFESFVACADRPAPVEGRKCRLGLNTHPATHPITHGHHRTFPRSKEARRAKLRETAGGIKTTGKDQQGALPPRGGGGGGGGGGRCPARVRWRLRRKAFDRKGHTTRAKTHKLFILPHLHSTTSSPHPPPPPPPPPPTTHHHHVLLLLLLAAAGCARSLQGERLRRQRGGAHAQRAQPPGGGRQDAGQRLRRWERPPRPLDDTAKTRRRRRHCRRLKPTARQI